MTKNLKKRLKTLNKHEAKLIWRKLRRMHRTRHACLSILLAEVQRNSVTYRRLYIQCVYL